MHNLRFRLVAFVAFCGFGMTARAVHADENETRFYRASVDGRVSGVFTMEFLRRSDGSETIAINADIKVRALFREYHYTHQGVEAWTKGQLVSLQTVTNDDGKKTSVSARRGNNGLDVSVDGKSRLAAGNALSSTGAILPNPVSKSMDVILLDVDDGSDTPARLEPLGACSVAIQGATIRGQKYQLKGKDIDHEWWFDEQSRMIRQSLLWDGHRVTLELIEIRRP